MQVSDDAKSPEIEEILKTYEERTLLRFTTCGSVDDGKSTLIGRLLFETNKIYDDQLDALKKDSKKSGTQYGSIDFALLVDGLSAEREQGITIDIAYRYFATQKRKFIIADSPGHEQYTRNMATASSTADLAIILIDARKGVLQQTFRHSFITFLLGIKHVVLAVNKMDLVDYSQDVYDALVDEYSEFAKKLAKDSDHNFSITPIPLSALAGDNITTKSVNTPWYEGHTLLEHLEEVEVGRLKSEKPFRLPVQWINRRNMDFRGYAGKIASGSIRVGEKIISFPSGVESKIASIWVGFDNVNEAQAGQSVLVSFENEIDVSRGDTIVSSSETVRPDISNQFSTTLLWLSEDAMMPGRQYIIKSGTRTAYVTMAVLKHKINVTTLAPEPANKLDMNEVGMANIGTDQEIVFDPYVENHETGSFILIDRLSHKTVGLGTIHFALRRASNLQWQNLEITQDFRARQKGQKPVILWLTGLSGAGKSTIANIIEQKLTQFGKHTYLLDGDNVRHGLNMDLGFTSADRVENIRRVSEVSKLMIDAGLITIVSLISPFRSEREMVRSMVGENKFIEIFIDTPIEVAEERDVKGLYAKARRGEIKNFTGIDSPYENPLNPEITIDTLSLSAEDAANLVIEKLRDLSIL